MKFYVIFELCIFIIMADVSESNDSISLDQKIIGDVRVPSENGRYIAAFRKGDSHLCSATLISEKHLVTAAHCLHDFMLESTLPNFSEYHVVFGLLDWKLQGTNYSISEVQALSRYDPYIYSPTYDIGLIKLLEPVTRSDSIGWIPLATQTDPIDFKSAFEVPAWGYKDDSKLMVLKKIDVAYKPNMACKMPYQAAIICVSLFKNADTLMKVNIGAPLIQNNLVLGILAHLQPNHLAIFANTTKFRNKICEMQIDRKMLYTKHLPRKRARHDHESSNRTKRRELKLRNATDVVNTETSNED